ncbi:chaperonin GroL [Candidatus Nomurabacteria bacterium RIFCSPLOWO2_02_FULL_42_17]|uniref:Chaperonin GroEL n=1 Tax=Candidatus Nomurabacteria bacterium RIFCSPLOWO2_02_FULL_42_17 TaxID=1801789 RepID=A0A1F6XTV4_9BACT|nr:MAG: 60 kDa chaperonin [Parcubacteria group bacterium GW2011_GWA2_42_18]OGI97590.1 MAG: chaperonin GroL [Candidatus Nomurabacteria bacterium RIFCSPLOWO2_02_FULL_42_17]
MAKQIIWSEEARKKLKQGIDKVANAVRITLGPRGRNVVLDKGYGAPMVTNDGVSIAKEITLTDKFENMGAEIIKEVAEKTNETAGDGTTTSVILAEAIISEGLKRASMGANGMVIRRGIERAKEDAVIELKKLAKPIKNKDEIRQVATLAAESEEIGKIIAGTIEKVGKDGVVTVEESQSFGVDSEVVEGLEFDKGYVSPYMITDAERMEAVYNQPSILITDKKISAIKEILPLLEKLAQTGKKELVIIAEEVEGDALATFVVNKLRGTFSILAVKAPGFGDHKKELLGDIAVTVGAKVISEEVGIKLENADLSALGSARKVIATKDKTVIVGGRGKKQEIEKHVAQLKAQREATESKYDIEKIDERIAKLTGGVAIIKVGAATETEMKYLKLKIEDAVNATKAAIAEGIVAGGGTALVKVAGKLSRRVAASGDSEFAIGYNALVNALYTPLRQIAVNAGRDDGAVIVEKVKKSAGDAFGYDASGDPAAEAEISDLIKAGIVDPVKVTRTALENAASAAAMLITTEVAIADEPEKKTPPESPDHHEF